MNIPSFEDFMQPLLKLAGDGIDHNLQEAYGILAKQLSLSDEQMQEMLPSGTQLTFQNRIGWAKSHLIKAGLLSSVKRGHFIITDLGKQELELNKPSLDCQYLLKYPGLKEWYKKSNNRTTGNNDNGKEEVQSKTPIELVENGIEELNRDLAQELLSQIMSCSPSFFERLVVELLVKMGYGGSRKEAGSVIGKVGDGGIDGIIKEDKLGLDTIYIQAKRWDGSVSRPEIQKFVGALQGNRAKKGIFITTSKYTKEASDYVNNIDNKVILIDGEMLSRLMIEHDVGVNEVNVYKIKRIDNDYFSEE